MKTKSLLTLGVLLSLFMTLACSKQQGDDPQPSPDPQKISWFKGLNAQYDSLQFESPVMYLGGLKARDEVWLRARAGFMLVHDTSVADIFFVGNSLLPANIKELNEAYRNGKFIFVAYPDFKLLGQLKKKYGWNIVLPGKTPEFDSIFGFCKNHSIMVPAPKRIIRDLTKDAEPHDDILEVKGEEDYQNNSILMACKGIMNFIINAKADLAQTKNSTAASGLESKINTVYYDIVVNAHWETEMRNRYLRVYNSFETNYACYPCYIPEDVNNHGDYYTIKATATNYAPTMYEWDGTDPDKYVKGPAHYWPREYSYRGDCQFRGPYNTQLTFSCYSGNKDSEQLKFTADGIPSPATDIGTKQYSKTDSFSWEVGLSGGFSEGDGFGIGFNAGVGGSTSNTIQYDMSDMKIVDDHNSNIISYEFNYQNLPEEDSDFDNFESQMPDICKSTATFPMMWEWTTTTPTNDYDEKIIPLETVAKQGINIWARDKSHGFWYNYMNSYTYKISDTADSIFAIARVPVGCLRVNNKCSDNQILYGITVFNEKGDTAAFNSSNVSKDEFYEVILPQKNHTYKVIMRMGKSSPNSIPYTSENEVIKLPLLQGSDEDKFTLSATEYGGDFKTHCGLVRITNQSSLKLVRNIVIYRASDNEDVFTYPNSLGYNNTADIYVDADVEYYVTMEFGSSSSFDIYRTASNFTLKAYESESDIKSLIVTATGGDFVKM